MQVTPLNDHQLIDSYLNGDERAFQELLSRYQQKIYTSIYLFVKDEAQAEDIFQEVFIKIINTLRSGKYNHEGKFGQWALRIAYNMCVDNFRRGKRRPVVQAGDVFDVFDVLHCPDPNAEQLMMRSQNHDKIRRLVDMLPPEQREVVILRHYADMSFKEIAALTSKSTPFLTINWPQ